LAKSSELLSVARGGHIDRGSLCLRRHGVVWALPDQAWMPSPASVVRRFDAVTGPFAYVRLLGDREAVGALTPTLDHIVIDRGEQVAEDARAIPVLRQRVPVVAFVNNNFAGYAPETVRQLVALTDATTGQRGPS
jgi:hypothetical protein